MVRRRALALCAVVAHAYGWPDEAAMGWLRQEALSDELSPLESRFMLQGAGRPEEFQLNVQALWSLAWLLSLVTEFPWQRSPPVDLVHKFPDLKAGQGIGLFVEHSRLRTSVEVLAEADLAYCIHASCVDLAIEDRAPPFLPQAVAARRRPLEWVISTDEWDDVELDT